VYDIFLAVGRFDIVVVVLACMFGSRVVRYLVLECVSKCFWGAGVGCCGSAFSMLS